MKSVQENETAVKAAMAEFPATFGLRAFPGDVFRIGERQSYVNDSGVVMLYTQRYDVTREQWMDFAKGTAGELRREVVKVADNSSTQNVRQAIQSQESPAAIPDYWETLHNVCAALKEQGYTATVEGGGAAPGFLFVTLADGRMVAFGDSAETWGGEIYANEEASEMGDYTDCLDAGVSREETDRDRIAAAFIATYGR